MSNKSSYWQLVKKPNWYEGNNDVIVKCSNENCIEEGTIDCLQDVQLITANIVAG